MMGRKVREFGRRRGWLGFGGTVPLRRDVLSAIRGILMSISAYHLQSKVRTHNQRIYSQIGMPFASFLEADVKKSTDALDYAWYPAHLSFLPVLRNFIHNKTPS